ncbi:creatininase family protein [Paenibacillus sp. LjRoot56]|uniref:creatininase family protein n=1 Tax=Paenibacillus sp. LjRoot56 TaxID=3342333 RepID=UPI003ED12626
MLTMYNNRTDFLNTECDTAILPVGALEQHGSHLPYGTDNIIAGALAERIAETLNAYLLPPISIASSIEHRAAKGTVYLKADTLALVIRDIAESLLYSGFRRLILINGHGGNWILKPTIRQLNRDFADRENEMEVILIHTSVALGRQHEVMEHTKHDIHGGEKETSHILHLCPEHVKDYVPQAAPTSVPQDFMDYFDVTELTEDGYWGYPEVASAEKGLKMMDLMVECSLAYLKQIEEEKERIRKLKQ